MTLRRLPRLIGLAGAATLLLLVVAASGARSASAQQGGWSPPIGGAECWGLMACHSVVSPWVVADVSPSVPGPLYNWSVQCPMNYWAAGIDGNMKGNDPTVPGLAFWSSLRDWDGGGGQWMMALGVGADSTFQMRVGCIPADRPCPTPSGYCNPGDAPKSAAIRGAATIRATVRMKDRRLRANRTTRHSHHCRRGERAIAHGFGVGFLKKRAPSVRELRDVDVAGRRVGRFLHVRVTTGPRAGDNEPLQVQLSLLCR